jgi:type IX secretion system substrate protein
MIKTGRPVFTLLLCSLLALIFIFPFGPQPAAQQGRIGIRMDEGKARFYDKTTGERFVPRGFNYIQLVLSPEGPYGESELFQPDSHDQEAIDDDFQRMAALGYNVVRVFVDLCRGTRCIADENGLVPEYIDNIAGLLQRARQYNIRVMLTANWLPDVGGYSAPAHAICESSGDFYGGNCLIMSSKGVELYEKFFSDFVLALIDAGAPMETIWAYELRNEFFVENDQLPFSKSFGTVTTANGLSYNMASQADKQKMGEDAVVYWANATRDAIVAVDPNALVTSGFFTPNTPNEIRPGDQRIVPFVAALERSELDFFGIHTYAGFNDFRLDAENYGIVGYTAKPVVLGEYGIFLDLAPDVYSAAEITDRWQTDACTYGIEAFTFWTWDRHRLPFTNPDDPWAGSDEGAFIAKVLSPDNKQNSCEIVLPKTNVAEGMPTAASMEWDDFVSANVVDGNATGMPWIAGGNPPQWVEVDLQDMHDLAAIQLVVETGSLDPQFYTHEIQIKSYEVDDYETIHTFSGLRVNQDVITYPEDGNGFIPEVGFIRVVITQAPGWAALYELRALLPQERERFDVPPPPILTFPRPGLDVFSGTEIVWKNDVNGLSAHLQIALDSAFENIIEHPADITADRYDISHLDAYDILYWRARQTNEYGPSRWSVVGLIDRTTVGLDALGMWNEVTLYPNPVTNDLIIEMHSDDTQNVYARIHAANGAHILTRKLSGARQSLDLHALTPGVYVLTITDAHKRGVWKLIKI